MHTASVSQAPSLIIVVVGAMVVVVEYGVINKHYSK